MTIAFHRVAAGIFALVAVAHVCRAVAQVPIQVGSMSVPMWASWVAAVVTGALAVWAYRSRA